MNNDLLITPQIRGSRAEYAVISRLIQMGHSVVKAPYGFPYDLYVDGKLRVEIKVANCLNGNPLNRWTVNFHRHGILKENEIDIYIIRLENVPFFKYAIHLLFNAPIKKYTLNLSLRALIYKYSSNALAFQKFKLP